MQNNIICADCARKMFRDVGIVVAVYAKVIGYSKPYEVYHADQFQCPDCKKTVIAGFAQSPIWRHHDPLPMPECQAAVYEWNMPLPTAETPA